MGALSSTAVIDFYRPFVAPERSSAHYMNAGRTFTVLFGGILIVVALSFPPDDDLLDAAFGWASLIYGSLLGVFTLGALTRSRGHDALNAVIMFVGVGMLAVVKFVGGDEPVIAWPWWIVVGTVWTFGAGALFRGRNHGSNPPTA
jgi:Na+/proline symporter